MEIMSNTIVEHVKLRGGQCMRLQVVGKMTENENEEVIR